MYIAGPSKLHMNPVILEQTDTIYHWLDQLHQNNRARLNRRPNESRILDEKPAPYLYHNYFGFYHPVTKQHYSMVNLDRYEVFLQDVLDSIYAMFVQWKVYEHPD